MRALKAVERPDEMEAGVISLERRWQAARERIESLLKTVETAPKDVGNSIHQYNYNPTENLKKDTVIATKECSGAEETSPSRVQCSCPRAANSI